MPVYEYKCTDCDTTVERWQSFNDSPLTECPSCHGRLRRVIHPAGIVFKGSGWYSTDSRSAPPSPNGNHHESSATVKVSSGS